MTKNKKLIIFGGIFIFFTALLLIYFLGFTARLGFCPPGKKIDGGFIKFCYSPSTFEGKFCDNKSECGGGNCLLTHPEKEKNKGICDDFTFGCNVYIDNMGNYNEKDVLCVD